jgi:hypothetical protein
MSAPGNSHVPGFKGFFAFTLGGLQVTFMTLFSFKAVSLSAIASSMCAWLGIFQWTEIVPRYPVYSCVKLQFCFAPSYRSGTHTAELVKARPVRAFARGPTVMLCETL